MYKEKLTGKSDLGTLRYCQMPFHLSRLNNEYFSAMFQSLNV